MSRIAFANLQFGNDSSYRKFPKLVDPVHLVAMDNICRSAGHQSNIFTLGQPSLQTSIKEIVEFRPDILALSFVGYNQENLAVARQIKNAFPDGEKPKLMLGGTDIEHHFDTYFDEFSPWVMAVGEGEKLISFLARNGFNLNDALALKISSEVYRDDKTYVFASIPHISLNEQVYTRNYDFAPYDNEAWVKWSTGCWGKCNFCANPKAPIDYRSAELAAKEAVHLQTLGVEKINIASPNFTNIPRLASLIVEAVPDIIMYRFESRVDSMYWAVKRFPDVWKKFGRCFNAIELGVESFIPQRLGPDRMRKYPNSKQALGQEEKINYILNFFKGSMVKINLFLINYDWQMTLEEAEFETKTARKYVLDFPDNLLIETDRFDRFLNFSAGSYFSNNMEPIDFLNFKRDPRVFWLFILFSEQLTKLKGYLIERGLYFGIITNTVVAPILLDYLLERIEELKQIPADNLNLDTALKILKSTLSEEKIESFLSRKIIFPDLPLEHIYEKVRKATERHNEQFNKLRQQIIGESA